MKKTCQREDEKQPQKQPPAKSWAAEVFRYRYFIHGNHHFSLKSCVFNIEIDF
jgi:hypothetical protein